MSQDLELHSRPVLVPRVRLQADPVTGEPVLLYPEGIMVLNETAHAILKSCDGVATIEEVIHNLAAEYEASSEDLRPDVLECLRDLRERNLITAKP